MCQKCTDIALHEEVDDVPPHPSPTSSEGTSSRPGSDRKVSFKLSGAVELVKRVWPEIYISLLKSNPMLLNHILQLPRAQGCLCNLQFWLPSSFIILLLVPFQGLPPQVVAPYTNGGENSDQLNDLFDFSKVPDVDQATRSRMGSKCRLWGL